MFVRDVMTTKVVTARRQDSLKKVASILLDNQISGLPVVSDEGSVVGVLSEGDFVVKEARLGAPGGRAARVGRRGPVQESVTTGEAMTTPPVVIAPDAPLAEAANLMLRRQVNRLPVISQGRLVGIVTRADLVRAYTRSDSEIQESIERALRAVDDLSVVVDGGVVRLSGVIATASLTDTVVGLAEAVPGVISVDATGLRSADRHGGRSS